MTELIFTLDYEIYGNGTGSLLEHVYEPTEKLAALFKRYGARFVVFAEAAELEILEAAGTDPGIGPVKEQLRRLHDEGFEIGLHIHPQWYNARHEDGAWRMDYREYNLCILAAERIEAIVDRAISYLRRVLAQPGFSPVSFRAGNWLFQPTKPLADVLACHGVKVDSSVFKGGLQRSLGLDYRRAWRNGNFWRFSDRVDLADPAGTLLELPIHTQMVPFWRMATGKRLALQRRAAPADVVRGGWKSRLRDRLRLQYPRKLDFCRMGPEETIRAVGRACRTARPATESYVPLVAIGHSKDLVDLATVDTLLRHLGDRGIGVTTLQTAQAACSGRGTEA